jgi:predicted RNA-binding Zn-ribbon protein involved in translation (DUF1610 family)
MTFFDFLRDHTGQPAAAKRADNPHSCPKCGSSSITTTAKNPNPSSYWRCQACGEIWNGSRPRAARGSWR